MFCFLQTETIIEVSPSTGSGYVPGYVPGNRRGKNWCFLFYMKFGWLWTINPRPVPPALLGPLGSDL